MILKFKVYKLKKNKKKILNIQFSLRFFMHILKLNISKKSLHLLEVSKILFTFVNDKENCVFRGFHPLRIENFSRTVQLDGNFKFQNDHSSLLFFTWKKE